MNSADSLKLSNQVCFPIYSVSRLITKAYKPYLDKMGLTYPQYLVMMVLWENNVIAVNHIAEKLFLNTNTVSPLLQRMEKLELVHRTHSIKDERTVLIQLTKKGKQLKNQATPIPEKLLDELLTDHIKVPDIIHLKKMLDEWINVLSIKDQKLKS